MYVSFPIKSEYNQGRTKCDATPLQGVSLTGSIDSDLGFAFTFERHSPGDIEGSIDRPRRVDLRWFSGYLTLDPLLHLTHHPPD